MKVAISSVLMLAFEGWMRTVRGAARLHLPCILFGAVSAVCDRVLLCLHRCRIDPIGDIGSTISAVGMTTAVLLPPGVFVWWLAQIFCQGYRGA